MIKIKNLEYQTLHDLGVDKKDKIEVYEPGEGEKYSIFSDSMFKAMFQNEKRIKYSCKLLSYLFEISYEELLNNLVLVKNEVDKEKENSKGNRCDYVAYIDNTYINIEINQNSSLSTLLRNIQYIDSIYAKKNKKGKKENKENYNYCVQVNINNFSFKNNDKIFDIFMNQNKDGIVLDDHKIFINIYIPNLRRKCYTKGIESLEEVEKYLLVLTEKGIRETKEIGGNIGIMEEYIDEAIEVSNESGFGEAYDKEEALYETAMEHGIEKGETNKQLEIAKKMIGKHMNIVDIIELTGLTEEEIESLKEMEKDIK
jgi:predicted transposase/invertase (TIGR01784 family)